MNDPSSSMNDNVVSAEYLLNEAQTLLLCMKADTNVAADIRAEMVAIIKAWRRGKLLPRHEAPTLMSRIYNGEPF